MCQLRIRPPQPDFMPRFSTHRRLPESPYFLQVNCTDQKGIRSFELFPVAPRSGNRRSQIMLPPSARSNLLETLADRNFTGFESRYGGREQPAKSAAPARVTCRIRIEIQNLEKSSVQMTGGEQSAQLLNLAAELLDHAEQYHRERRDPGRSAGRPG